MRNCSAAGCGKPTGRYGRFCNKHSTRQRSQGHVDQMPVPRRELAPWLKIVRPIIARNRGTDALRITRQRWERLLADCRATVEAAVFHIPTRHVSLALLAVDQEASFEEIFETTCAAFLFRDLDQHRFRSPEAFAAQHVRLVRRLATTAVGSKVNPRTGKEEGVHRVFPLLASITMHNMIVRTIGPAVAVIVKAAKAERAEDYEYRTALAEIA